MTLARIALTVLVLASPSLAQDSSPDDAFITGYATAILERELHLPSVSFTVREGVIRLSRGGLGASDRQRAIETLGRIKGVARVEFGDEPAANVTDANAPAAREPAVTTSPDTSAHFRLGVSRLFEPLLADPRWPHFYATYAHGSGDVPDDLLNIGFGESFSLAHWNVGQTRRLELGLQAGVFAFFTTDDGGLDLINADYFVGPTLTFRDGDFSLMARLYHQSSHLGDDYLLDSAENRASRFNVSFEAIDLLASYDLPAGFRVYGGVGSLIHHDPDLDPLLLQYGLEFQSERAYWGGLIRPIAAIDLQHRDYTDFDLDLSVRAGVQLQDAAREGQRLQILFEYYHGRNPNGQFYEDRIEYFGIGTHFYF